MTRFARGLFYESPNLHHKTISHELHRSVTLPFSVLHIALLLETVRAKA